MNYEITKGHTKKVGMYIDDDMATFAIENEEGNKLLKECFRLLNELITKYEADNLPNQ